MDRHQRPEIESEGAEHDVTTETETNEEVNEEEAKEEKEEVKEESELEKLQKELASSGTEVTESFDVLDGYSIVNVITDEYDHLIFTMSDGSTIDAGKLPEEKVKISSDEGNIIEQRDDGIYVPSTPVNISDTDGNILESKSDGLYATIVFETEDVDFNNY